MKTICRKGASLPVERNRMFFSIIGLNTLEKDAFPLCWVCELSFLQQERQGWPSLDFLLDWCGNLLSIKEELRLWLLTGFGRLHFSALELDELGPRLPNVRIRIPRPS